MTLIRATCGDDCTWYYMDGAEASAPIMCLGPDGWESTQYQTADAQHGARIRSLIRGIESSYLLDDEGLEVVEIDDDELDLEDLQMLAPYAEPSAGRLRELLVEAILDTDGDAAAAICELARDLGMSVELEADDQEDEECGEPEKYRGSRVASKREYRITLDGETVATLTREGWSYYGDPRHPNTPSGEWTTDPGAGDEWPSRVWEAMCECAGDEAREWECAPCAEEPLEVLPETDPDGPYCLYWDTVGDDAGPRPATRYPTLADAQIAAAAAEHELHRRHRGQLLCGYAIAELVDGEWVQMADD